MVDQFLFFKAREVFDTDAPSLHSSTYYVWLFKQWSEYERQESILQGISIVRGAKELNHSQFANDTLLLGGASVVIIERFKVMFDFFVNASGGNINKRNTNIYGWNVSPHLMNLIANTLEFTSVQNWTSFIYFDTPIMMGNLTTSDWQVKVHKIMKKIRQWG